MKKYEVRIVMQLTSVVEAEDEKEAEWVAMETATAAINYAVDDGAFLDAKRNKLDLERIIGEGRFENAEKALRQNGDPSCFVIDPRENAKIILVIKKDGE